MPPASPACQAPGISSPAGGMGKWAISGGSAEPQRRLQELSTLLVWPGRGSCWWRWEMARSRDSLEPALPCTTPGPPLHRSHRMLCISPPAQPIKDRTCVDGVNGLPVGITGGKVLEEAWTNGGLLYRTPAVGIPRPIWTQRQSKAHSHPPTCAAWGSAVIAGAKPNTILHPCTLVVTFHYPII